ncbi:HEPN domain-containing protein [Afipia broomeae]|uniref:RiboL-PSP-HEPN domain-containing protein n=1 Tax=Afipia broomeae ATCC 49717 TaxID=883078 RepID=K8NYS5_9BRAD|nr:HEPN domain-containing protein [Afipia broomeae]EKS34336.1 hypothetical protein HMPREF9695_04246 [Afipia broomeae ATCC 49717]
MPIRPRFPTLNLESVDELIQVRKLQHGGGRGAPPKLPGGERVGAAINKSCIFMLSALLQTYIEEVFMLASKGLFKSLSVASAEKSYRNTINRWGNPSDRNIQHLFLRLGAFDIFEGLMVQKRDASSIKAALKELNELRNRIAHGKPMKGTISLQEVIGFRDFVSAFSKEFAGHVYKTLHRG